MRLWAKGEREVGGKREQHARKLLLFLAFAVIMAVLPGNCVFAEGMNHTLVIDPGHGGLDGGASAADGTAESGINLAIAQRVWLLTRLFGVDARLTRDSETLDYPADAHTVHEKKLWDQKSRVALIESIDGAALLSIHQNRFPDSRPSGSQALYARTAGSEAWAKLTHAALIQALCPENRRVAAPISEDVFLLRSVTCPAILVECGFLSNPAEAERLKTDACQRRIAVVLFATFLEWESQYEREDEILLHGMRQ